jgi:hypothetical protein
MGRASEPQRSCLTHYGISRKVAGLNPDEVKQNKKTLWLQSASELYRPSDRRLSAKLVPTFCG